MDEVYGIINAFESLEKTGNEEKIKKEDMDELKKMIEEKKKKDKLNQNGKE